jgi:hypothetical protein
VVSVLDALVRRIVAEERYVRRIVSAINVQLVLELM